MNTEIIVHKKYGIAIVRVGDRLTVVRYKYVPW